MVLGLQQIELRGKFTKAFEEYCRWNEPRCHDRLTSQIVGVCDAPDDSATPTRGDITAPARGELVEVRCRPQAGEWRIRG